MPADGAPLPRRMDGDDYVRALATLERCVASGRRKARVSDGFCAGCGHKPSEAEHYESYQVMK